MNISQTRNTFIIIQISTAVFCKCRKHVVLFALCIHRGCDIWCRESITALRLNSISLYGKWLNNRYNCVTTYIIHNAICIKYVVYIWERPAETGHRARMIYFEKNGFQYSTRVFVRKKAFRNKNNGTIGKSRKKSIHIGPWYFFSKTQHTIMSELNRAPFTRKRHRARSVARFCWTLPYMQSIYIPIIKER